MNHLLDLDKILYDTKSRERDKLAVFELVLLKCHSQIVRYAKDHKATECKFSIPFTMLGYPPYNPSILTNYLISHLEDNGLKVTHLKHENKLHISWKQSDLQYDRYQKRKKRIQMQSEFSIMQEAARAPQQSGGQEQVGFHNFLRHFN